jgi:CYTH domain-containing protein
MGIFDAVDKVDADAEKANVVIAQESISTEVEKEYCVWVKPSDAGWTWLEEQSGVMTTDLLLPTDKGRRRVRIKESAATLTLKRWSKEGTKEEHSEIGMRTALSFYDISPNVHVFKRITIPTPEYSEQAGSSKWDIDVFYTYGGNAEAYYQRLSAFEELMGEMSDRGEASLWVKVELEVERFFTDSIIDLIPFEVTEVMPSRPKSEVMQATLTHHWDVLTNWK